jgi:outer membrane receptor protein involved in Fe transport
MNLLNTEHYPIDLRVRSALAWSYRQADVSITINYTNHYRDTDTQPNEPIASLTTFDLLLRYSIGERDTPGGVEIHAGVQNITNRPPPFVVNVQGAVGYDQENADPYLRTWMLSILKRW